MNQLQRRRAKAIFHEALEMPARERHDFVRSKAGNELELETAVIELLDAHDVAGEFFGAPTLGHDRASTLAGEEAVGDVIGNFVLREKIGEGGFGVVWRAEQTSPVRRDVALKVIKLGMDTKAVVARFEAERQALALMDHPSIARVFDGGATAQGRPYFVMEFVRGVPITRYCDEHALSTRERLAIFTIVCRAVQHAHQKGVIHRDIKPGNVLVTLQDGRPVPKVIDFGIAKATSARLSETTLNTELRQVVGTPEYMAPEQASRSGLDIDTRADVYSLGVLLYELLTGAKPFDIADMREETWDEIVRTIREVEPRKPSTRVATLASETRSKIEECRRTRDLPRALSGDLDWIVMKALEKERERRYETALALAEDVERHLDDQAVLASPPSRIYRFSKLVRRNRLVFGAGAVVFVALVGGMGAALWGRFEARAQRKAAEAQTRRATSELATRRRVAHFLGDMLRGAGPSVAMGRDATILREILERTKKKLDTELEGEDDVRAGLLDVLGSVMVEIGDLDEAVLVHAESVRLWRKVHQEPHPDLAIAENNLANALLTRGRVDEAEGHARESLRLFALLPDAPPAEVARARDNFGLILLQEKRFAEAEVELGASIDIEREANVAYGPNVGTAVENFAELERQRGNNAEAERLYVESLARARAGLGPDHPRTLMIENNLAATWCDMGRDAEAKVELERVLEALHKVYGPRNQISAMTLENLATAKKHLGDVDGAVSDYDEALAIHRANFSGDATRTAHALCRKGRILIQAGRDKDARPSIDEGVAMYERLSGPPDPDWAEGLADRAHYREEDKDLAGAESDLRHAIVIASAIDPAGRPLGVYRNQLGGVLRASNRLVEAAVEVGGAVEVMRQLPQHDSAGLATMLGNLAALRLESGDAQGAEVAARESLELRHGQGSKAQELAESSFWLWSALIRLERYEEAQRYLAEFLEHELVLAGKNSRKRCERLRFVALYSLRARATDWGRERLLEALTLESDPARRDLAGFGQTAATLAAFDVMRGRPEESIENLRECVAMADLKPEDKLATSGQRLLLAAQLIEVAAARHELAAAREAALLIAAARAAREEILTADDWRMRYVTCLSASAAAECAAEDPGLSPSERRARLDGALAILEDGLPKLVAGDMPQPTASLRLPTATAACARLHEALAKLDPAGGHAEAARRWRETTAEVRTRSVD